jgi:hypothetical protein
VSVSTQSPLLMQESVERYAHDVHALAEGTLKIGAGQPLRPAAFKIRLVISCGCEIRDR